MNADLFDAICVALAFAAITLMTMENHLRVRRASMEPPTLGELHFRDGYIIGYSEQTPDDAIERLIKAARTPSAYLPPFKGFHPIAGMSDDC